jgi:hypothetical protein
MKTIFIIFVLFISQRVFAANDLSPTKEALKVLIQMLLKNTQNNERSTNHQFSTSKCEKYQINWMEVLLMKDSSSITFTFKDGCDIEGVVRPRVLAPFPINLKLKNLQDFHSLKSENKITSTLEEKPILNLEIRSAILSSSKGSILFEADYSVRINPLKKKDMIEENIGGEIRLLEIDGKKVKIIEKIMLK